MNSKKINCENKNKKINDFKMSLSDKKKFFRLKEIGELQNTLKEKKCITKGLVTIALVVSVAAIGSSYYFLYGNEANQNSYIKTTTNSVGYTTEEIIKTKDEYDEISENIVYYGEIMVDQNGDAFQTVTTFNIENYDEDLVKNALLNGDTTTLSSINDDIVVTIQKKENGMDEGYFEITTKSFDETLTDKVYFTFDEKGLLYVSGVLLIVSMNILLMKSLIRKEYEDLGMLYDALKAHDPENAEKILKDFMENDYTSKKKLDKIRTREKIDN